MQHDDHTRRHNQQRLRELVGAHTDQVNVFSAHDHTEFDQLTQTAPAR